ncbi:bifunctional DedA family/phosphatase PAP2 family protein [Pseudofrankia sp. DC12]|uniref:bifunctional DedA family/phosphatase PAP2 family protein n=1 Tax=Pseudofrankia sp. DC12 TaxID=683315 RepID=UPI000A0484F0|nr:bifunctional DedA family/phosphatase PAP2 family protein [Pseudofrankia sp. DC12]
MSKIVDGLINLPPWLVLLVAFALPAAEASIFVGVVFPGEIAIIVAGVLAHAHKLPLWLVIVVGTLGAVIGDSIGYEVGARYGDWVLARLPKRLVKPEHVEQGRALLRRRGGWAVLIGRFTAALRALVPGLAGTSRLPYRTFLPYNLVGGLAWVTMSALIGYIAGASYKAAEHQVSLISGGLLALIVLVVLHQIARKSQRVQSWLARHRYKLPDRWLTASVLMLTAGGWLLAGLVQDAQGPTGAASSDSRLLHDVIGYQRAWLTPVARGITTLGAWPVAYGVVVVLGGLVAWRARNRVLPLCSVALLGAGQGVRLAISHAVARPRPPRGLWLTGADGYSFPSGHTTLATIAYGLAGLLLLRLLPASRLATVLVSLVAAVLAAAVGVSRVYLGVHWPSDVAGGWSLGVGWLALATTVYTLVRLVRLRRSANRLVPAEAAPEPQVVSPAP